MGDPPDWLLELPAKVSAGDPYFSWFVPPGSGVRQAAVLILVGSGDRGPDVLLIERAADLRAHAGQPAFPGGAVDAADADAAAAALRETVEEVGIDPAGVDVIGVLPVLHLAVSAFAVTPVLGWWRDPAPTLRAAPAEVAAVARVPIAELVEPANRVRVRLRSGYLGPAFEVGGMLVWGFTAMVLDRLLELAGLSRPWLPSPVRDIDRQLSAPWDRR
ncbi:MAG: NUDIX hydrolase [Mycobacteriales bacterium]